MNGIRNKKQATKIMSLTFVGVLHHCNGIKNYSIELETSLRAELFTNYSIKQRPTKTVGVSVSFTILTINDLVRVH